ncbi:MAG: MFS transporter [Chloroflexi bacterium]|nr:MFS transporter [Chloroflexota bacterium]
MVGSLILASLPNQKRGSMLLASGVVLGLSLVAFSFSRIWYLSLAIIIFVGLGQAGRMTLSNTLLQYYVKNEYRGRVMSMLQMEWAISSLGAFFAALLAESMGVQWAVGGFALVLALLSVLSFIFVPRLRKLD